MRLRLPRTARVMLVIAGCTSPACLSDPPEAAAAEAPEEESLIVALAVNGETVEDSVLALRRDDGFYLPVTALTGNRVKVPEGTPRVAGPGSDYIRLADLPGVTAGFDQARQELQLKVPPDGIERQVVNLSRAPKTPLQPSAPGAYLNYDAVAQDSAGSLYLASLFDVGTPVFGGDLSSTGILRTGSFGGGAGFVRLDTSFLREFQDDLTQLKLGDSITRGSSWGSPLRFAGVQYGTNFTVQPGYVAYPTANFAGQAALPSTVDVYINNALRYRGDVAPGPFELAQVPAVSGGGTAQVVVTDLLGRQQSVALPFYVDTGILREGVADFSYEAGFLRDRYGLAGDDYGAFLISATERYGISDALTIEGHGEATTGRQAAGLSLTSVLVPWGEVQGEAAAAHGPGGTGWLAGFGYTRQTGPWSIGLRQTWETDAFDSGAVSFAAEASPERAQTQANLGVNLGGFGSLALTAVRQRYDGEATATISSVTWTLPINDRAFVNTYLLNARQGDSTTTLGLTLTFLFGGNWSGTVDGEREAGQFSGTAQLRHSPPGELGWDYGATIATGMLNRQEADVTWRSLAGDFGLGLDREASDTSVRLTASGGVALVDDKLFVTRRLNDAFGLVSVPGYPGVGVTQDNRLIGTTDQDGDLFLPSLLSNNPNHIGLVTGDLPVDIDIDTLETTATPAYRGIARIRFQAQPTIARLVVLTDETGQPIEPGIVVERAGDGKAFRSGFGGEVYLEGEAGQRFTATNRNTLCHFDLPAKSPTRSVPTLICKAAS